MDGSPNNDSANYQDHGGRESTSPKPVEQAAGASKGMRTMQAEQSTGFSASSVTPPFQPASDLLPPMSSPCSPLANQVGQVQVQCSADENSTSEATLSPSSLSTYMSPLCMMSPSEISTQRARKTPDTMDDTGFTQSSAPHSPTAPLRSPVHAQLPVASPPQSPRNQNPPVGGEATGNEASTTRTIMSPPPDLSPTPMVPAGPPSLSANETPDAWGHHSASATPERTTLWALLEQSPQFRTMAAGNKSPTMQPRRPVPCAPFSAPGGTEFSEMLLDDYSSGASSPMSPPFGTRKVPNTQAGFATSTPGRLPPHRMNKGPKVASASTACAERNTSEEKCTTPSGSSLSSLGGPSRRGAAELTPNVVRTPDVSTRDLSIGHRTGSKRANSPPFHGGRTSKENMLGYMAVALTVLLFCVLLTVMVNFLLPPDNPDLICTTAPCEALDALLEGSLYSGTEACDNFYEHICGGWARAQNVSVYQNHLGDFIREVHTGLSAVQVPARVQTAAQMVAALYQSCAAVVVGGADALPAFRAHLERVGLAWPKVSPSSNLALTAAQVYRDFRVTALLRIRRMARKGAGDMLEIAPDQGFLGDWEKTRDQLLRNGVYERFFEETKYLYADNGILSGRELKYGEFLKTESLILDSLAGEEIFGNTVLMEGVKALPVVVNITVTSWLSVTEKLDLSKNTLVVITNIGHLSKLDKLVSALSEPYLHYYFGWYVVQQMRRYMDKAMAESWYNFAATYLGVDDAGDRRADCLELVESIVGRLAFESFVPSRVDAGDEAYVTSMAAALSQDFTQKVVISGARSNLSTSPPLTTSLFQVDFHEDVMRVVKEALAKSDLTNQTSLLSNWMDIVGAMREMNTTLRDSVPTTYIHDLSVNKRYSLFDDRSENLSLPPLFSMLPVYERQLTDAAKFGALGTLLATGMMQTSMVRLPANSTFRKEIARRLHCFNDSAESLYNNLDLSLPVASAQVALSALQALPRSDHLRLRTFNRLQTFFAVMCYLLCAPIASNGSLVAEAICNEAVKNSDSFQLAFECAADSAMNPGVKCQMF